MLKYFLLLSAICGFGASLEWDFITYTLAWPQTFCKYNKCNYPKSQVTGWNIHGLWPSNSSGSDPFECGDEPFNKDKIQSIYNELLVQWANLLDFDVPVEFWTHEWKKHGTCSLDDPLFINQLSYFQNALYLKYNISLDKIFRNNNIIPSSDNLYDTNIVANSIIRALNVIPKLECIHMDGNYYLSAVEICFSRDLKAINCPKHHHEANKNSLESAIHEIFQKINWYLLDTLQKPVNLPCAEHQFYLPI